MVGAMRGAGPAQTRRGLGDTLAMGGEAGTIGIAYPLGAAEDFFALSIGGFKAGAAGIGKILFRRIDDAHQMAFHALMRQLLHPVERIFFQKIAEPNQLIAAREWYLWRQHALGLAEHGAADE